MAENRILQLCHNITNATNTSEGQANATGRAPFPLAEFAAAGFIFLTLFICAVIILQTASESKGDLLMTLRRAPAYEEHRIIEEEFGKHFKPEYEDRTELGRYPIVTHHDDLVNKIRTVTVVEDLNFHVPLSPGRPCLTYPREGEGQYRPEHRREQRQRAEQIDEVERLLAFSDRSDAAYEAWAAGRSQNTTSRTSKQNECQDLPPPYPSESS